MKIFDLIITRTDDDVKEIAKRLKMQYPGYYPTIEKGIEHFNIFKNECVKAGLTQNPELADFVVNCMPYFEDDYESVKYLDEDKKEINYTSLPVYFCVDGIHLNELLKKEKQCGSVKALKEDKEVFLTTYGLDFLKRSDILNLEIMQNCVDKFNHNTLSAEIFWELTFYGLFNEQAEDEVDRISGDCHEAMEDYKARQEEIEDTEPNKEILEDFEPDFVIDQEELNFITTVGLKNRDLFYQEIEEYLKNYRDTQVKEIMDRIEINER